MESENLAGKQDTMKPKEFNLGNQENLQWIKETITLEIGEIAM